LIIFHLLQAIRTTDNVPQISEIFRVAYIQIKRMYVGDLRNRSTRT